MASQIVLTRPYESLQSVGIALRWIAEHDQVHAGILLREDAKTVLLCHLAFHHKLLIGAPEDGYYWADCSMFVGSRENRANGNVFTAWMLNVADNPSVPYGFKFDEHCFDENGNYMPMELGKGLTCATFIIAAFHSAGYNIIQPETWKAREDDAIWQAKILGLLETHATAEHVVAAAKYVGHFRYKPEEAAAGAIAAPPALAFDECLPLAEEILATIRAN